MNNVLDLLFGIGKLIRNRLGRPYQDWLVWANTNPGAASLQLSLIGRTLEERSKSRKRQRGLIARRERAMAEAMFLQAADLRKQAEGQECGRDPFRRPGS